jgi:hypothetical protein
MRKRRQNTCGGRQLADTKFGEADLDIFTLFHTLLSLVWLVAGFSVVAGLLHSRTSNAWTVTFLVTGVLTCLTGYGFQSSFMPSHVVGALSLVVLALAILGLYVFHLAGSWRWIYAVSIVIAFWFNSFVAVVQAFRKIPFLNAFAPTQSEPPFAIVQVIVLLVIAWLTYSAVKKFHPGMAAAH